MDTLTKSRRSLLYQENSRAKL